MAGLNTETTTTAYYPPRARWYRSIFSFGFAFQRLLHLEKIHLPRGVSFQRFLLSLLVPGYAFTANGQRIPGYALTGAYGFAATVFMVLLGYPAGDVAYGLMISAHAASLIFLEGYWLRDSQFHVRCGLAVVTLLALWLAVYAPAVGFIHRHWFMPVRVRGAVMVVRRAGSFDRIRRGDRVVYTLNEVESGEVHHGGGALWVQAGLGFGPVLALGGDRVEFFTNCCRVNGMERPLLPFMPHGGEFRVPGKEWFIWPEFDISRRGNVNDANISAAIMQLATVSKSQLVGRPFERWFGRRQITP